MVHINPPREPLTDDVVTLRLPSMAAGDGDAAVRSSGDEGQLYDFWLPMVPGSSPEASIKDWLEGWAGRPSHTGPVLVVTIPEAADFIGIVGFAEREDDRVEMIYGIVPPWRGRGFASRAARVGGRWALTRPGVAAVEVRISQNAGASQRVAQKAGFRPAGIVSSDNSEHDLYEPGLRLCGGPWTVGVRQQRRDQPMDSRMRHNNRDEMTSRSRST